MAPTHPLTVSRRTHNPASPWTGFKHLVGAQRSNWIFTAKLQLQLLSIFVLLILFLGVNVFYYDLIAFHFDSALSQIIPDQATRSAITATAVARIEEYSITFQIIVLIVAAMVAYVVLRVVFAPIKKQLWSKKKFTDDLVHDLRAPLSIMKIYLELGIKSPNVPDEVRGYLKENMDQVDIMATMVDDLLMLDRYNNKDSALEFSPINLSTTAKHIANTMMPLASNKGVALEIHTGNAAFLIADPTAIERMIKNVLRNAIEYTPRGGSVTLTVAKRNGDAVLTVEDTGTGIDPADLPHIFERFHRSLATKKMGGLGLAIVKEIVDKHKAKIEVQSEKGKGTTITVRFKNPGKTSGGKFPGKPR